MSGRVCASEKGLNHGMRNRRFMLLAAMTVWSAASALSAIHFDVVIMVYTKTQFLVLLVESSPR
jgi:hypothetical protein